MFPMSVVVLMCALCLGFTHGLYQAPMCRTPSKPCRIRVFMGTSAEPEFQSSDADICTCAAPFHCSNDWDRSGYVISRRVVSTYYNITLQMMFCRQVEPKRRCSRRNRDVALVVKGSLALPQDIVAYNCRCRRRQPLLLHQRYIGSDHLNYHEYVCANHKPYCNRRAHCMTVNYERTNYHCKCPSGNRCRTDPNSTVFDGDVQGVCMPVQFESPL